MAILKQAKIALDLLDSAQGHAVQTWTFEDQAVVKIGRAEENDLKIVDPRVSRLHAELELQPTGWKLISHGRNGVYIDNLPVSEQLMTNRRTFQLGSAGPILRFRDDLQPVHNVTTIDGIDPSIFHGLQIDQRKQEEEVKEITSGNLFQQLKQRAEEMRRKNSDQQSKSDPPTAPS